MLTKIDPVRAIRNAVTRILVVAGADPRVCREIQIVEEALATIEHHPERDLQISASCSMRRCPDCGSSHDASETSCPSCDLFR